MKKPINGRIVYLFGDIDESKSITIISELSRIVSEDKDKLITFFITSEGGSALVAFALYEYITEVLKPSNLQTVVLGGAYSMTPILLLAGDYRVISSYADLYFHFIGRSYSGRLDPVKIQTRLFPLKVSNRKYIDIVAYRTGMRQTAILELMKKEKMIHPKQALGLGFVHEILDRK